MVHSAGRSSVDVGAVIAGTYTIEGLLGRGGMGAVWLAFFWRNLAGRSLVPAHDPYFKEAVAHGGH